MANLKKLTFAPLFLLSFGYLCFLINPFLASTDSLFSLSLASLLQPLILAAFVLLTSFLFVVFVTLAQDWTLEGVVIVAAGIIPIVFLPSPLNLYLTAGTTISLVIIHTILLNKLKTYLNFQPSVLLASSVRNLSTILVLVITLLYFQSLNTTISHNGFQLPDSLIDSVTNLSTTPDLDQLQNLPALDPQLVKDAAKSQIQTLIKPYQSFIAPALAILIFFTLTSFISLLSFLTPVLLWALFGFLKSIGFIKFVTEMREVKKLVV